MKYILWIPIFLFLHGCSAKESTMKIYTIDSNINFKAYNHKFKNKIIKIAYPQGLKEKMSQNMHFTYNDLEQGSYKNSEWSNSIGQLLQGNFIQILQQSGLFKGVTSYTSVAQEDYRLESTVFDFSHRVRGNISHAIISVQFSLIETDSGKMVKSKLFNYAIPTMTTDANGYVNATNIALNNLNRDLIDWLNS